MIKYSILLINFLFGLLFFVNDGVSLTMEAPSQINAGSEFTITVHVKKGNLSNYGRYKHALPIGFTAVSGITPNGDFSFKEQQVRFLWMSLPAEEEFTITYTIQVDAGISGPFDMGGGEFRYIVENEISSFEIESHTLIIGEGDVSDLTTDDVSNINTIIEPEITMAEVSVSRTKIYTPNEINVSIHVIKGGNTEFAKIQEDIAPGYKATSVEKSGAIFTAKEDQVKFLWVNLPPENEFTISYKLVPKTTEININNLITTGIFSYLGDVETETIVIDEPTENTNAFIASLAENYVFGGDDLATIKTETTEIEVETIEVEVETIEVETTEVTTISTPESDIAYSVQICALRGYREPSYFNSHKYDLNDRIRLEPHEGWNKYIIGSFLMYKDARDQRTELWNNTIVNDAFVTAYNHGERITVQEALMISSQQWYE